MGSQDEDRCACGKSIDDVSLAHYLSCGEDAAMAQGEAEDFVGRVADRVDRSLASPMFERAITAISAAHQLRDSDKP